MLCLFPPLLWGMLKHLVEHHEVMGLSTSHLAWPSRNTLTSISHSVSQTNKPSLSACPLAVRDLSLLLQYFSVSNLWYLKKKREHYSTWNWWHGQSGMTTLSPGQAQGWATHEAQLQTISTNDNSKYALLFSPGKSQQLTNLLYHVLRVNNHFCLAIKINLLQLKNTHISNILPKACIFLGLHHVLTSLPHF